MPTVIATVGAADANSFVTRAEADTYLDAQLNTSAAWTGTDDKDRALIQATGILSALTDWIGTKLTTTQALAWPRDAAVNPDEAQPVETKIRTPVYFATDVIPWRVKHATIELALALRRAGTDNPFGDQAALNVKREKTGPLETEYFTSAERSAVAGLGRFPRVVALIAPLRRGAGLRVTRG